MKTVYSILLVYLSFGMMSGCKKENEKEQPKENYPDTNLYLLSSYKNSENPLDNFSYCLF